MPRPTLTTIALSMAASFATLLLALAPALGPAAVPAAPQDALRVLGVGAFGASEAHEPRTGAEPANAQAADAIRRSSSG